jgi:hypothetical protein
MNDLSRVRVSGPLGLYASGFRAELEAQGYSPGTVAVKLQLVAGLSRWLSAHDLGVGDLTSARIEEFFEVRRARVRVLFVSSRALGDIRASTSGWRYTPASTTPPSRRSYFPMGCAGSSAAAEELSLHAGRAVIVSILNSGAPGCSAGLLTGQGRSYRSSACPTNQWRRPSAEC